MMKPGILDALGIDALCDLIESGDSQAKIARELGIDKSVLTRWINEDDQRLARVKYSREVSAEALYEQVDDEILQAEDMFALTRAKELGQHRRKWAAIRNPKYGDKQQIDLNDITPRSQDEVDKKLAAIMAKLNADKPDATANPEG